MRVVFGPGTDTMRWAWSEGLRAHDQQEIAVPITWDHGNWRDDQVRDFLEGFDAYVREPPKRIVAGDHMRHFWTVLRFRASDHNDIGVPTGMLVVQELADPLRDVAPSYTDGAQRAIMLLMAQRYATHQAGLDQDIDPPFAWMAAELCGKVNPHGGSSLEIQRYAPKAVNAEILQAGEADEDSGWLIACTDPSHAHSEPGATLRTHLIHMVQHYSHIFTYLALPAGSRVRFEGESVTVFRPGDLTPLHVTSRPFSGLH
jgi:hypothetical protein